MLLKDDKSYPWICVTKELFPRVFITREKHTRGAKYFGPYPKTEVAHALVDTLKQLYPIRTCRHPLNEENVSAQKYKLCLQYHIKNCEGCCQGFVSHETYSAYIADIIKILNGDTKQVSDFLMQEMMEKAAELKFEDAELLKRKYQLLESYRAKSVIVNTAIHNVDVFSIVRDDTAAYVNYMHLRNGAIVQSMTVEYKFQDAGSDETPQEILSTAVRDIRERFAHTYEQDRVKEILVNVVPDFEIEGIDYIVPQRGDKRKLVAISLKNAEQYRTEKYKRMEKLNPEQRVMRTLTTMMKDLHLPGLPHHIECFDNSSISGTNAVASCVVFRDAKPSKKDYRHFNIKEADGSDDYASMREVMHRRYSRLFIDKNSETLRIIQRLRDESHRFGITHHRNKRSKSQLHSQLDDIKGIGPKTRTALLKHFKSVKRLKTASPSEIALVVGDAKARLVISALEQNSEE